PVEPRPGGHGSVGQGPDEVEGRAAHDRDLAPGPLRGLRPARRGPRRLAAVGGRGAHAPARHPQEPRREEGRCDHPHRGRGRYREKAPLMEASGVDAEIRSTLSRRVDLPSGGYLVFDYAEAFTVIDVNTGRFVGSRGKSSGGRLEDTITKNNLEAVKEVVRQL